MVHTLATQTRILSLTIVILQLRHNIATVGFGRPKLGHKDSPIIKEGYNHCTYFDAYGRSDPMIIHPACTPYRLVWQISLLLTCSRYPVSTPSYTCVQVTWIMCDNVLRCSASCCCVPDQVAPPR